MLPEGEGPWLLAGRPLPGGGRHGRRRGHGGRCNTVHLLDAAAEDERCKAKLLDHGCLYFDLKQKLNRTMYKRQELEGV
jgi:hypothetical protein